MLAIVVSACQSTPSSKPKELNREAGQSRIILMPPDVQLSELEAGGTLEPKGDWTAAAKTDMVEAFKAQGVARNIVFVDYDEDKLPADKRDTVHRVTKLYGAVGVSIFRHQYGDLKLPTKDNGFDWSLGPSVSVLREQYGADYALLAYARDSYSSDGRQALKIVGAIAGISVPGGRQFAFVSLIDLRTGDIVWYHHLNRDTGDLRGKEHANGTVATLLEGFPK